MGFQKIIPWVVILVLSLSGLSTIEAAGREKPEPQGGEQCPPSILVNSWLRDKMIQVALANITGEAQRIKVAIGTEEIQSELFASQTLSIPARSISIVYFPVLRQKTSRGALKDSDYVSVYRSDGSLIDLKPVQQADRSRVQLTTDSFLAASGDDINISYDLGPGQGLRLVFVPRSLRIQEKMLIPGRLRDGSFPACAEEDLSKLGLPDEYRIQARTKLADHYGFIVKDGETARITVDYTVPEITDCAVVRLSDYQYFFARGGSVTQGAGLGALVMVYNPSIIKIAPLHPLVREGQGGGKQKIK
jgi:hypothetical protein